MHIISADFALEWVRPLPPNVKYVGPLSPKPAQPLPADLQAMLSLQCPWARLPCWKLYVKAVETLPLDYLPFRPVNSWQQVFAYLFPASEALITCCCQRLTINVLIPGVPRGSSSWRSAVRLLGDTIQHRSGYLLHPQLTHCCISHMPLNVLSRHPKVS